MVCVRGEEDEEDDGGPGGVKSKHSGVREKRERERERDRERERVFLESCGAEDSEIEGVYEIYIFLFSC